MAVSTTTRVGTLATELGISDRELIMKASEHGMALAVFSRLDAAQVRKIRSLFKVRGDAAEARRAPATTVGAGAGAGTVRRRRVRRPTQETEAVQAPASTPTVTAPEPIAAPVSETSTTVRRRSTAGDRPVLRRAKVEDVEVPLELQLRPAVTEEEQAPAAEPVVEAAETPAETRPESVVEAAPEAVPTAAAPVEPAAVEAAPPAVAAEAAGPEVTVEAAPEPVAVAPEAAIETSPAPEPMVEAHAEPEESPLIIPESDPHADGPTVARVGTVTVDIIGRALDNSAPAPSERKVPRLIRAKMPEALVNIPKPVIRPAVAAAARAEREAATARAAERSRPAAEASPGRPAVAATPGRGPDRAPAGGAGPGGRGRKVIYDRRRDGGSRFGDDGRRGRKRTKGKTLRTAPLTVPKAEKRHLKIEDTITVGNLAHQMSVKATEVIKKLFDLGIMATINNTLDLDTVELVASEFGFTVENVAFDLESFLTQPEEVLATELPRSPVVTVMGHVDHGKTTLLDAIRNTRVAAREAGGITQHIGAYAVDMGEKGRVVFLDTPGHEAFTAMRARGAKATDVIVLVVAADDGVMPQTIEAINHAKAAEVPLIVAINKIDKVGADPDRVRRELADHGVLLENWGGDVTACEISAKTGKGIDNLLETLALQAEIMELTANPNCDGRGLIIEARLERGRGAVATVLVQHGHIRKGDYMVAGGVYGRIRAMMDHTGQPLEDAGPSTPVEIIGFNGVAVAGDDCYVTPDEKSAKSIVDHRLTKSREREAAKTSKVSVDSMFAKMEEASTKDLNVIIKADVHGSAEALRGSLARLEHDDVKVKVLHAAAGGVTESDIQLAAASGAMILAFNVKPEAKGKRLADDLGVRIFPFSVIYEAIDHVLLAMEGMLDPIIEEVVHGHAEVRAVFHIARAGQIAGCYVTDGKMVRSFRMRLTRDDETLWEGSVAALKRFKEDTSEVTASYECGISLNGFSKYRVGDIIECFDIKTTPRKLEIDRPYRPNAG